jgi:hypothetical protein
VADTIIEWTAKKQPDPCCTCLLSEPICKKWFWFPVLVLVSSFGFRFKKQFRVRVTNYFIYFFGIRFWKKIINVQTARHKNSYVKEIKKAWQQHFKKFKN